MEKRLIAWTLYVLVFGLSLPAGAQKIPRVGILRAGASLAPGEPDVLIDALRKLGYVEGKNISIEMRYAQGSRERLREFALELVHSKVDAIYTGSSPAIFALKQATQTIPIVIVSFTDPVRSGIIPSLAKPGGNITGMSLISADLWPKRLELIKEIVPTALRVAIFWNKSSTGMAFEAKATQEAAAPMGIMLQDRGVRDPSELEVVFGAMSKERPDAFLALMDVPLRAHQKRILDFLAQHRVPAIFESKEWVEAGGLISYGPDGADVIRRSAAQLDKILKGAKPSEIPVEQPTKFEMLVNLRTAQHIGLTIPPNLLARADRVIR